MVVEEVRIGMRVRVLTEDLEGEVTDRCEEEDGPRFIVLYDRHPDDTSCQCGCSECCDSDYPLLGYARPEELVAV